MELYKRFEGFIPERHGQNLALPVVYAPYSVDSDVPLPSLKGREVGCLKNGASQGQNLALIVLFVPDSLENGNARMD